MKRTQRVFGDIDALRYVDDRLDGDRRVAFERHLATDADQAGRVRVWARQNDVLRGAFVGVAAEPVPLWLRLDQLGLDKDAENSDEPARRTPLGSRLDPPRLARFAPPAT